MFNIKDLGKAIRQIADEKSLSEEKIIDAIETSIAAAYKKEYGNRGDIIKCRLHLKTGDVDFWQIKTVVDDTVVRIPVDGEELVPDVADGESDEVKLPRYNSDRHILLDEARQIKADVSVGDELTFPLETHSDFGRIAAQTAKQVILQKLRESERDSILSEWKDKEQTLVSGLIQRFERGHVYVDLGRTIGVMFANESVRGEHYRQGERLRFLVLAVQEDTRLPGIILSRSHPDFVRKLFELEVPELADGTCAIASIAREAGSRTKIAVSSTISGVDPVGAFVGQRGTRVMAVNNELGNEKIDIIEYSEDPAEFIGYSLSPAKVESVEILPRREARVFVADDQLSLAIGRGGQNVRLAAKLTGWKIDVRSIAKPDEVQDGGVAQEVAEPLSDSLGESPVADSGVQ
ncbi:MAG: transcription elongation factor NusA, utilization substance protein [Candidatus Parcubacteria bacterium]